MPNNATALANLENWAVIVLLRPIFQLKQSTRQLDVRFMIPYVEVKKKTYDWIPDISIAMIIWGLMPLSIRDLR